VSQELKTAANKTIGKVSDTVLLLQINTSKN